MQILINVFSFFKFKNFYFSRIKNIVNTSQNHYQITNVFKEMYDKNSVKVLLNYPNLFH